MSKLNPRAKQNIDAYIAELPDFSKKICSKLRKIILQAIPGVVEDWKWGPNYQHPKGHMICGFGAFKAWVTLTFFNGALMKDNKHLFNYGKGNAHNRSIKFSSVKEINDRALTLYLKEACKILENPLKKSAIKPKLTLPRDVEQLLKKEKKLTLFESLTHSMQKEHILSIENAKKMETRERRIKKLIHSLKKPR